MYEHDLSSAQQQGPWERWCSPDVKICDFGLSARNLSGKEMKEAEWPEQLHEDVDEDGR